MFDLAALSMVPEGREAASNIVDLPVWAIAPDGCTKPRNPIPIPRWKGRPGESGKGTGHCGPQHNRSKQRLVLPHIQPRKIGETVQKMPFSEDLAFRFSTVFLRKPTRLGGAS